jgi:5'-AMP-activated protein kinase regulatory gamma subunit
MDTEPPLSLPQGPSGPGQLLQNERQVVRQAGRQAIRQFLEQHNCYSVLRASGKVVVFDVRIPIQLAFYALVEHDMQAAPLWDSVTCQFAGLLTVTDFIDILRHYKAAGKDVSALAVSSIAHVLSEGTSTQQHVVSAGVTADSKSNNNGTTEAAAQSPATQAQQQTLQLVQPFKPEFNGADSSCTLAQACQQLLKSRQDFLPVVFAEDMRCLACITYTNILEHLVLHFREQRRLFDDSLMDLGIGTYGTNLVACYPTQTLAKALELMQEHSLSALPVLDPETGKIVGVYSRSDITFLTKATDAEDAVRNLDLPLADILSQQRTDVTTPDALRTCSATHTLQAIF